MVYLDNASTTKPCEEAVSAITNTLKNNFGNPSSMHAMGIESQAVLQRARKAIASAISCEAERVFFTSGATESNNLALFGAAEIYGKRHKKIIISSVEHPSVAEPAERLEKAGFEVVKIRPDSNGEISYEEIVSQADENTCLISIMLVNNETGYILPVGKAFAEIKRKFPHIITHCDAVQAFLKIPIKSKQLNADIISLSGHKVYSAKGIGAIYVKKGIRISPILVGGGQEKKLRSGTESVPLIDGFLASVERFSADVEQRYGQVVELKAYLTKRLNAIDGVSILSLENSSPYIVSIAVSGIKSEIMLHFLEARRVYVSSGSACSKGAKSSVLKEFGVSDKLLDFVLRISFSAENTKDDIDKLVEAIIQGQSELIKIKN